MMWMRRTPPSVSARATSAAWSRDAAIGPDRFRLCLDLRGHTAAHDVASDPATMTSTPRSRSAAIVSVRAASFVTIVSTSSSPNT